MKTLVQFPFPLVIGKEGKWFVAECPWLGIATQGKTEKEIRENMRDLISEYLSDPDMKIRLREKVFPSWTYIPVSVPEKVF